MNLPQNRKSRMRTDAPASTSPPSSMTFSVGPFIYRMVIVTQPPTFKGKPCDGLIDFLNETISIHAKLNGKRRLNVLLHELAHAWRYHFPIPCKEEDQCDLFANAAQTAMQDLLSQGGIDALDAMQPADEPMAAIGGAA